MKKGLNVIQIKGISGIIYVTFIGVCLIAGFGWFPSWCCMKLWNLVSHYIINIPSIGIVQGGLLWGIIAGSYFTFRKEKLVVCMRAEEGLTEEELREVFSNMKTQAREDMFLKNLFKAQEAELRIKNLSKSNIPGVNIDDVKKVSLDISENDPSEKVQSK